MSDTKPGRDSDKFMLRFPDGMRDRIREAADANKRSMNAEIVARLESTFERIVTGEHLPERIWGEDFDARVMERAEMMVESASQRLIQRMIAAGVLPKDEK